MIDLVSVGIRCGIIVCHSFVIHSEQIKWRHATTSMDGVAYSHTHIDSLAICYLCNKDLYSHTHMHVCVCFILVHICFNSKVKFSVFCVLIYL